MLKILQISKTPNKEIIKETLSVLKQGGLVVFPTETMYGIGADATNQKAIDKLLSYKARREGKPLSIAVSSVEMAKKYVDINKSAKNLYDNFLPGPLTVVSKGKGKVAKGVESETKTLGVRIPDYKLVLDIISKFKKPITATSANASYKKRPYKIDDVLNNIGDKQKKLIDLIIDAGELPKNEPSTVVDTTLGEKTVLRQGSMKLTPVLKIKSKSPEHTREIGGNLVDKYKHYLGYKSVIFALEGELGAGKTEMTKGMANALGVKESINSPTFIIEKEYHLATKRNSFLREKKPLFYHIDTWRLFESSELEQMGFLKQVSAGNVFAIEWADKIIDLLKQVSEDAIIVWIKIEHGKKENTRLITVKDYKN